MEVWDLYTEDGQKTGETHIRGNELPENRYHLAVHIWIRNKEGKFLISQRARYKKSFPLFWECVGGSVLQGETSLDGAIREVKEEVGIDLDKTTGKLIFEKVRKFEDNRKFNDILNVWFFEYDGPIDLSKATTDEVQDAKWLTYEEIQELDKQGKFVYTLRYFYEMFSKC